MAFHPDPTVERIHQFHTDLKIKLCELAGYDESLTDFIKGSLIHQSLEPAKFFKRYLKHTAYYPAEDKEIFKQLFSTTQTENMREEQLISEYSVLIIGPDHYRPRILQDLGRYVLKTEGTMDCYLDAHLALDKRVFDIVQNWITVTCHWEPSLKRIRRMITWVSDCLLNPDCDHLFIQHMQLPMDHMIMLIHIHEELSRMAHSITDIVTHGSPINTILNEHSSTPLVVINKEAMSNIPHDFLKHTKLYSSKIPPFMQKNYAVKCESFTAVLHNGKYQPIGSAHLCAILQALWECTGVAYVDEDEHKWIITSPPKLLEKSRVRVREEDFLYRFNQITYNCDKHITYEPEDVPKRLSRFEPVDLVADYESSHIASINETHDFLLGAIKDYVYNRQQQELTSS